MKEDRFTKFLLIFIALLLLLNLFRPFIHQPSALAGEENETGRYQISIWSVQGNESSFYPNGSYGYYILDTKTGKIVDERQNNI